jgi:hypothetical protein
MVALPLRGALGAEITPDEPDPGNAGEGRRELEAIRVAAEAGLCSAGAKIERRCPDR